MGPRDRGDDVTRVIPAMDLLGGRVVRLHRGDYEQVTVFHEDPLAVFETFVAQGATRAHLVDLDGARDGAPTQSPLVARVLARFGDRLTLQVGGGIRTVAQARAYVDAGARRVVVGTAAVEHPGFITALAAFTEVVVALDARDGLVATRGWTHTTTLSALALAKTCVDAGARALLYTDIARDGTGEGPNLDATEALARAVPGTEVIASGGIGSLAHLQALAQRPVITSVVVGRALYEGRFTVGEALAAGGAP
jgi:phosphoribosylformimino-5-aminoimidazole carboxamide ribotide isomerase